MYWTRFIPGIFMVRTRVSVGGIVMDLEKKVVLVKNLEVSDLAGEKVMIDFESGKYFMLKGSANEIWELIQEEKSIGEIIRSLMEIYIVKEEECRNALEDFLNALLKYRFIQVI